MSLGLENYVQCITKCMQLCAQVKFTKMGPHLVCTHEREGEKQMHTLSYTGKGG